VLEDLLLSYERVEMKKALKDTVQAVRTSSEVNTVVEQAIVLINRGRSRFHGMTYEEGVRNAIEWLLGDIDDNPMED